LQDFGMAEAEILQFHFEDQDTTFATTRRVAAPCAAQRAIVAHPELSIPLAAVLQRKA
jgi:hypothetical protein